MKRIAIIPARMAATRFPNKPLAKICGIPMVAHIWKRAIESKIFDAVYVATPDEEISTYINSIGGESVMTSHSHLRCTDRTGEALLKIESKLGTTFDIVGMIQGDEPLVVPSIFTEAINTLEKDPSLPMLNVIGKIESQDEFESPNTVKVVCDKDNNALYLSREPIPSRKKFLGSVPQLKQTGLIFFRRDFLLEFIGLEATPLENIESVDVLRVLEHGKKIKLLLTSHPCFGVDIPSDIQKVEPYMLKDELYQSYKNSLGVVS